MNSSIKKTEMRLGWDLIPAEFIDRPNRFITRVKLNGKIVESHLPDPGRLTEILIPGVEVLVKKENGPNRKTKFSTQMVKCGNYLVSVNSWLPNDFVNFIIPHGFPGILRDWEISRREVKYGMSRFDFLLAKDDEEMVMEVKSVTLVEEGVALFPDSVTARGKRHMEHLSQISINGGNAMVLFVVQREDAELVKPHWGRDPEFASSLLKAQEQEVMIKAIRVKITPQGLIYHGELPVDVSKF